MHRDPVIEELRRHTERIAEECDDDVHRMAERYRRLFPELSHRIVSRSDQRQARPGEGAHWEADPSESKAPLSKREHALRNQVLVVMSDTRPLTVDEIAKLAGIGRDVAIRTIAHLIDAGAVTETGPAYRRLSRDEQG